MRRSRWNDSDSRLLLRKTAGDVALWSKEKLGWENSDETGQHHVTVMDSVAVLLDGMSLPRRHEHRRFRALVDNIRGKKDRVIEGEVVKKDDGDG